jgi:AcrR family transcriptional regulator
MPPKVAAGSLEPTDGRMDKRVQRSRAVVLSAAAQLLSERGFGGVTVDEVSRRSGVAKTTIYRQWPARTDLLLDTCEMFSTPLATPDKGGLRDDILALTESLTERLRTARWTSVLPSIIDAAERDPEIADLYSRIQLGHSRPFEHIIRRGIERGELGSNVDIELMVACLTGPLFYRRWFSREPLTPEFARSVAESAIRAAGAD